MVGRHFAWSTAAFIMEPDIRGFIAFLEYVYCGIVNATCCLSLNK